MMPPSVIRRGQDRSALFKSMRFQASSEIASSALTSTPKFMRQGFYSEKLPAACRPTDIHLHKR
jgi:hypothetical protein